MNTSFLLVSYNLLPFVLAQLKECFRYDGSSSDDSPCDPVGNVSLSYLNSSAPVKI